MSSEYYTASGIPATRAALASATMRSEFSSIDAGFAKLPTMGGNGLSLVRVNASGNALEAVASVPVAQGGTGATTASAARTALGLGSGDTPGFAGLTLTAALPIDQGGTGSTSAGAARTALGLDSLATQATVNNDDWSGTALAVANGGTGATTASAARTALGLGDLAQQDTINNTDWSGNDLTVPNGGTGHSSFTAGSLLLGAGSGDIDNTGVLAKGTVLVGDGVGAPTQLPVGSNAQVLTADSAEASGVKWSSVGGGGGVGTLTTIERNGSQVGDQDISLLNFSSAFTATESTDTEIDIGIVDASESAKGIIEVATDAQVNAGSVGDLAIRPSSLAQWSGSGNITQVGTVTSGTWQGTAVAVNQGGTGATSASSARSNLGLGSSDSPSFATVNLSGSLAVSDGGTGATSASSARNNLGLGDLATQNTINNTDWSGTDLAIANGGTGSSTAGGARANLGLGDLSQQDTVNDNDWNGTDLAIANGGTGASSASSARSNLGLGSMATRDVTVSTSSPSGGSDGDLWFVREA